MTRTAPDREHLARLLGATRVVPLGVSVSGPVELLGMASRLGTARGPAAPSPMIHDTFFDGLTNPADWIEAA